MRNELSYSFAGDKFLILNIAAPWVKNYDEFLAMVSEMAKGSHCKFLACFTVKKSSNDFLRRKGWIGDDRILEYVL